MSMGPPTPPKPWYKRLYYRIEPRLIGRMRWRISVWFFMRRLKKFTWPQIRRKPAQLLTNELISVQPMKEPNGNVMFINYLENQGDGIEENT